MHISNLVVMGGTSSNRASLNPPVSGEIPLERQVSDKRPRTAAESEVMLLKQLDAGVCDENGRLELGHLLEWMDACSCLSAEKHCGRSAVTLVMDDLDFVAGSDELLRCGQACVLDGKVTRAFGSSMEVCVNVLIASMASGSLQSVCHAYFMYVVLKTEEEKSSKKKVEVPMLRPQNVEENLEYGLANQRKSFRMQREKRVQELSEAPTDEAGSLNKMSAVFAQGVLFTELVLPYHANHMGNTFGGQIMAWMSKGAIAAIWLFIRRCSSQGDPEDKLSVEKLSKMWLRPVSIDQIHFKSPSHVGDRVQVAAQVTRVFSTSLEVLVRVTSAGVAEQDNPTEVNVGYLTYAVHDQNGALQNVIPDVLPQTVEQQAEHAKAIARQQFRLQRRETTSKPESAAVGMSVDFKSDASHAHELAVQCISDILRVQGSRSLRWETLPDSGDGIQVLVDFGAATGDLVRVKMSTAVKAQPQACFEMFRDASQRKKWDISCVDCSDRQPIGDDAELVRLVMAAPGVMPPQPKSSTAPALRNPTAPDLGSPPMKLIEMLLLRAWQSDSASNSFIVASRSVRCDSMQLSEGKMHGELLPTGYIISESPDSDGTASLITFVGQFSRASFQFARPALVKITKSFRELMEKDAPKVESAAGEPAQDNQV